MNFISLRAFSRLGHFALKVCSTSLFVASFALIFIAASCSQSASKQQNIVILTTNDIHSSIDRFPQLASAVAQCRDTAQVILIDAGDKWTGNPYVDLVEGYAPIYELMNHLEYDIAIFGNHAFDKGQSYLNEAQKQAKFLTLCANLKSDTLAFDQPAASTKMKLGGIEFEFVGVVGNYGANNHPPGKTQSYQGLTFFDPFQTAAKIGTQSAREGSDNKLKFLISHSGLDRDRAFADDSLLSKSYDMVISSHSHDIANEQRNGILIGQTGNKLKNIGVTRVLRQDDGRLVLKYENISLDDYPKDEQTARMVAGYNNNPALKKAIGKVSATFDENGLGQLFASSIASKSESEIGIYHNGGIRVDSISKGDFRIDQLYQMEPFNSHIATMQMTPDQLRKMIIAKFNDKVNVDESHYIDLVSTTPYTILCNAAGDAEDVIFPDLKAGQKYSVAMSDYIFNTYNALEYSNGEVSDFTVLGAIEERFKLEKALSPDNKPRQNIRK